MTETLITSPSLALEARAPAGLIWRKDHWAPRRAGFIVQRELTCWNRHPIASRKQRSKVRTPVEGVIACDYRRPPGNGPACDALLYVFRIRAGRIFAMDLTPAEENTIELANMDLDEIIVHFGLSFTDR